MFRLASLTLITALSTAALAQAPVTQPNIDAAFAYHEANKGESMLVWQDGKILFNKNSAGYSGGPHALASGTKSFTCSIEAFAEADGLLKLSDHAADTITDWQADARKDITIADLLSLEAGLKSAGLIGSTGRTTDTFATAVNRMPIHKPGEMFIYDPMNFMDFAIILQTKTGGTYSPGGKVTGGTDPVAYLQQKLFTPLGISAGNVKWGRDMDGHPQMAGGAAMLPTDWLKYGQFMLADGKWEGKQLVDPALIHRCYTYKGPAFGGYGLTFWLNRVSNKRTSTYKDPMPKDGTPPPGMTQAAPHAPADEYMAAGLGKQRLYIIPSLKLIVVRFAPLSSEDDRGWSDDHFLGLLLGTWK